MVATELRYRKGVVFQLNRQKISREGVKKRTLPRLPLSGSRVAPDLGSLSEGAGERSEPEGVALFQALPV